MDCPLLEYSEIHTFETFDTLLEYLNGCESQFEMLRKQGLASIRTAWAKEDKGLSNESQDPADLDSWAYAIHETDMRYGETLPQFLRYSVLMLTYMLIENGLKEFCNDLKEDCELPVTLQSYCAVGEKKGFIKRVQDYIHKTAKIPWVDWAVIEEIMLVRNCLIHNMGYPDIQNWKKLKRIADKQVGLTIYGWDDMEIMGLEISSDYIRNRIPLVVDFFNSLAGTIRKHAVKYQTKE